MCECVLEGLPAARVDVVAFGDRRCDVFVPVRIDRRVRERIEGLGNAGSCCALTREVAAEDSVEGLYLPGQSDTSRASLGKAEICEARSADRIRVRGIGVRWGLAVSNDVKDSHIDQRTCRGYLHGWWGLANFGRMTSQPFAIPEVTYVTTALGCRLPLARVLCRCRMR